MKGNELLQAIGHFTFEFQSDLRRVTRVDVRKTVKRSEATIFMHRGPTQRHYIETASKLILITLSLAFILERGTVMGSDYQGSLVGNGLLHTSFPVQKPNDPQLNELPCHSAPCRRLHPSNRPNRQRW